MKRIFPILAVLTAVLLSYALYEALVAAPTEQTMGDVQRIFYYHVPSAWTAFILFFVNFFASVVYLIRRTTKADIVALVTAEVGVVFCSVVLVTGPIWARQVFQQWADSTVGRGAGRLRRARRSPGLLFHLVFPHPASPASHRRRRLHRSTHAPCSADQLGGVLLLCFPGLLVALSAGGFAQGSGRNPSFGSHARTPHFAHREILMTYLYAAYIATWVIHIGYLTTIFRSYARLKSEVEELAKK